MSVQLEFVAHACFRFWHDDRPLIVTDPYTHKTLGIADDGKRLEAETVIVSSLTDKAHDNVALVAGNPRVINALDAHRSNSDTMINDEPLITVEAAEAPNHPNGPNDNALYAFKVDDLWCMHMGDLGYQLTAEELAPFVGHCDVLIALIGEMMTPLHKELDVMIELLDPTWIVPMHYNVPPVTFTMSSIDKFIAHRAHDPVVLVRHHTVKFPLPMQHLGRPTIVVLEPSGYELSERLI